MCLEDAHYDAIRLAGQEGAFPAFAPVTGFYAKVHRACPRIKSGLRMKAAIIRYFFRGGSWVVAQALRPARTACPLHQ
ncbi:hypothetical protein E1956_14580 [Paraburkholderia pallida]|uniref:Uncharacterized protein n=1 Tax=Paraburkholderia pallida TaxID=2547399 RepID=A0A4P7CWA3_9BURK|nr:hypothetical protein E1956_14580 [Paraburkholderia pallida]